jgi:hypothetical protein
MIDQNFRVHIFQLTSQWSYRKSDLKRFLDLLNQGFIDHLIIGKEVESAWEPLLRGIIDSQLAKVNHSPKKIPSQ